VKIKEKFELITARGGSVYNVVPLRKGTLKAYEISREDYTYLVNLARTYGRTKGHVASKIIDDHMKKCIIVNLDVYPLPGFVTKSGDAVINLNALPGNLITDYSTSDIFALFLYTLSLRTFMGGKSIGTGVEANVAAMYFSIFMKLFGKRAGLIGAFDYLIPKLNFLIWLYVHAGILGLPITDSAKTKIASGLLVSYSDLDLNYNFESITDWLRCVNSNGILSISRQKFSSMIMSFAGINALPIFEDVSRLYSTILASTVSGNTQFSKVWMKINPPLFNKFVDLGLFTLKRRI